MNSFLSGKLVVSFLPELTFCKIKIDNVIWINITSNYTVCDFDKILMKKFILNKPIIY